MLLHTVNESIPKCFALDLRDAWELWELRDCEVRCNYKHCNQYTVTVNLVEGTGSDAAWCLGIRTDVHQAIIELGAVVRVCPLCEA